VRWVSTVLAGFTAFGLRAAIAQAQGPAEQNIDVLDDNVQAKPSGSFTAFSAWGTQRRDGRGHECCRDRLGGIQQRSSMPVFNATAEAWIVPRVSLCWFRVNAAARNGKACEPRVARGS